MPLNLADPEEMPVYKLPDAQIAIRFELPFAGKLTPNNRWVRLAHIIPWDELEEISRYRKNFGKTGNPALPFRVAFGALIIQTRLKTSDEETVEQVRENPYLQYFLGLEKYEDRPPFSASLLVHFRKRLSGEILNKLNLKVLELDRNLKTAGFPDQAKTGEKDHRDKDDQDGSGPGIPDETAGPVGGQEFGTEPAETPSPAGTLILDATCAPADIAYPTDLRLLNKARENAEKLIDIIHERSGKILPKPRTYRNEARKNFMRASKQRRLRGKKLRKALKHQLGYVRRDLKHIDAMLARYGETTLSEKETERLEVVRTVYRQQLEMYQKKTHRVDNRIVSIDQPHIRPIVRGKARTDVEFGAKIALAIDNGYALIDRLSWDNFNEGPTLIRSVEAYFDRHGYYPEVVCADQIYRNRENIRYCKAKGIRFSGPRLGRPPADPQKSRENKLIEREDAGTRNAVEGKFGEAKRAYGLGCVRGKLKETSETIIMLQFMVMNFWGMLRSFLSRISGWFKRARRPVSTSLAELVIHSLATSA